MNSVSRGVPPPAFLIEELAPAAAIGLGGLALDTPWYRGPVTAANEVVGVEALGRWRAAPIGLMRWNTPSVQCLACLNQATHAESEIYWPARQYREIAASFLRLVDDRGVLEFAQNWGLVRLHRHASERAMPSGAEWARALSDLARTASWHDGMPDLVDEVLDRAARAREAYEAAYSLDEAERTRGYANVVAVVRTMETRFAPGSLVVEAVPSSLLQLVYFALHGLYQGASRLVCAEWLAGGCPASLPVHDGRGRPRHYCSDRCAWRARNRRRSKATRRPPARANLPQL